MDATAVFVAYRTPVLDCTWIPDTAPVVVVHNDDILDPRSIERPKVRHIKAPGNIGFGAAVNRAMAIVNTTRIVLCNPDTSLTRDHWYALDGQADEMVTVPLLDDLGRSTSVVAPYWTPLTLAGTTLRLGAHLAPMGSARRRLLSKRSRWLGDQHRVGPGASLPLDRYWVSGAVVSIDIERMRSVDGFDPRYFLYFEDTDLCRRLAQRYPDMRARVADVASGMHAVGSTSSGAVSAVVARRRRHGALTYGASQSGWQWLPYRLLAPVHGWLS